MSEREQVLHEIEQVPDIFLSDVLDFVRYVKTKAIKDRMETLITSESVLNRDWLKPEEERAWQNL